VAGPVGRTPPPQIGRGRRGCGALVATYPPIRPGAAGWASGIPARSPLPTLWIRGPRPFPSELHAPQIPILPFRGGLLPAVGGEPEARPSPQVVPRPALGVEAPRVPVQAFGSGSKGDAPSDTTGHQVPRWEPEGTPIRLVSPSGAAAYLSEPSGFPRTAQVSPAYAFRRQTGNPQPVRRLTPRGSPVSQLLPCQYARMTRQPCCGNRTPHPTRFQARIGGPRCGGQYPWALGFP
jgi:hypothetical protein